MEPEIVGVVKKEKDDGKWINEEVIIKEEIVDNEERGVHRNETHERTSNIPKSVNEGPSILRSMLLNPIWIEDKIRKKIQQNETVSKNTTYKKINNKKPEFSNQSILRDMLLNPIRNENSKRKKTDQPRKNDESDDVVIVNPEVIRNTGVNKINDSSKNDAVTFSNRNDTITNNFKCTKRSSNNKNDNGTNVPIKKRNKGRMESTYQFGIVRVKPEVIENISVIDDIERINSDDMVNITNNKNDVKIETKIKTEPVKFVTVKKESNESDDDDENFARNIDDCKIDKTDLEDIQQIDIVEVKQEDETFYEDVQDPLAEEDDVDNVLPSVPVHIAGDGNDGKKEDYDAFNRWKTEKGTYQCDQCNREIRSVYYFKVHRMKHFSEKIYTCDECNKSFADLYTFKKHKELVHSVERPYVCMECTKAYKTQSELTIHARVHTGEAPYYCGVCNKNFRHSSSFARHKRIHSGIKPHVCEYCEKGFAGMSNLQIHKRTHTGERPYECKICNKKFSCMDYVNAHKIVHIQGKSHRCNICEKMYKSRATLKQHQINIHGLKDVIYEEVAPNTDDEDTADDNKSDIVDIKIENTD